MSGDGSYESPEILKAAQEMQTLWRGIQVFYTHTYTGYINAYRDGHNIYA
jgi:hypothetical protein